MGHAQRRCRAELSRVVDHRKTTTPLAGGLAPITASNRGTYIGGLIGATVPVGPGLIHVAYSRVDYRSGLGAGAPSAMAMGREASAGKLAVGYVHNLSKRTALYGSVARIRIRDGHDNPIVTGATTGGALAYLSTGARATGYVPRTASGFDLGIRHSF